MATDDLTPQRVRELFDYNRELGRLVRKKSIKGKSSREGSIPGYSDATTGYRRICIDRKMYLEHRLIWMHLHGAWPQHNLDHINGDRSDNRIENLRDVPVSVNNQNLKTGKSNSTSGFLGAVKNGARWSARIRVDGVQVHLGCFATPEEAHAVYMEEKRRRHIGCAI